MYLFIYFTSYRTRVLAWRSCSAVTSPMNQVRNGSDVLPKRKILISLCKNLEKRANKPDFKIISRSVPLVYIFFQFSFLRFQNFFKTVHGRNGVWWIIGQLLTCFVLLCHAYGLKENENLSKIRWHVSINVGSFILC